VASRPLHPQHRARAMCSWPKTHPDVAEVLDLLGNADPEADWAELYKVHGILLDNVPAFFQRGWVTRDQISTFRASATGPRSAPTWPGMPTLRVTRPRGP
jgi:hypothetical protein